jgi:glycosyltransferase involved in cell wall biosynthesis
MVSITAARPLVSVVLPTYNRAHTIERAIASVLDQSLADFELIVVDDGSTDATAAVLRRGADPRMRVIGVRDGASARAGCAAARNAGVRASRGVYVAFQDSDDEWRSDKLATAVAMLEGTAADTGVFYSDMLRADASGGRTALRAPAVTPGVLVDEATLDYQVHGIGIQSAVVKRACLQSSGLFDEALPRFVDLDLFIRLADRFRFVHAAVPLVTYHAGPGISTNAGAQVTARRYLLAKYRRRLARPAHHLAGQYLCLGLALAEAGRTLPACALVLRALATAPRHPRLRARVSALLRTRGTGWCRLPLHVSRRPTL